MIDIKELKQVSGLQDYMIIKEKVDQLINKELEMAILGTILTIPESYYEIEEYLKGNDDVFCHIENRLVYQIIKSIKKENDSPNIINVFQKLKELGSLDDKEWF